VVPNPRTQQSVDQAVDGRSTGPLLRNAWRRRMQPPNAAAILHRLSSSAGVTVPVTPHALRRSYITIGLLQGVPLRDMQRAAPPHQGRHHRRLRPVRALLSQGPHLRPHGRNRPVTADTRGLRDAADDLVDPGIPGRWPTLVESGLYEGAANARDKDLQSPLPLAGARRGPGLRLFGRHRGS